MSDHAPIHESETQRQFVRLRLPLNVTMDGKTFQALDWSSAGLAIGWHPDGNAGSAFAVNTVLPAKLAFPFEEFELSLPLDIEIRYIDTANHRLGGRFVNLTQRQVSMLSYLVQAYVSGEIIRAGDILEVAARNSFTTARKSPVSTEEAKPHPISRNMGVLLVALCGLGLLAYVAAGLYERIYVVEASGAEITADHMVLRAPSGGIVHFEAIEPGQKIEKGQPIATVESEGGSVSRLTAPANGYLTHRDVGNDDRVRLFDALAEFTPLDAKPYVMATVPYAGAVKLHAGEQAAIRLSGQAHPLGGKVQQVQMNGGNDAAAHLVILPSEPFDPAWVGRPVSIKIDSF